MQGIQQSSEPESLGVALVRDKVFGGRLDRDHAIAMYEEENPRLFGLSPIAPHRVTAFDDRAAATSIGCSGEPPGNSPASPSVRPGKGGAEGPGGGRRPRKSRAGSVNGSWVISRRGACSSYPHLIVARHAVERVLSGRSELRELWGESGADSSWHAEMRGLLVRLGADVGSAPSRAPRVDAQAGPPREPALARERQVLVTFLCARGFEPTREQMARIDSARDPVEIRRWLGRVVDAPSVAAVLSD